MAPTFCFEWNKEVLDFEKRLYEWFCFVYSALIHKEFALQSNVSIFLECNQMIQFLNAEDYSIVANR